MRDLESLDQAGIPIQSFYGVEGGYQIMDGFVLEKQAATNHEYDWIVTALKGMVSAYASKSLERTLAKVMSFNHTEDTTVSVDLSVAREDIRINEQLRLLEKRPVKKFKWNMRTVRSAAFGSKPPNTDWYACQNREV